MFEYKGYKGSCEFSEEDGLYFGSIQDIVGLYSYEGETENECEDDFKSIIDDHIANNNDYRGK
jgi:predicted RNase H-like HicB family nuclease